MTCPWWVRWWHRRLRILDVELMWVSLLDRADTEEEARVAWDVFLAQEGQDHWHCACGIPIKKLFRHLTITITAE